MAGNWCRGLHRGIGGTSFLSQSLPLAQSVSHTHVQKHTYTEVQKYTHLLENTIAKTCMQKPPQPAHTQICVYVHAR